VEEAERIEIRLLFGCLGWTREMLAIDVNPRD
jgi:hypothetical protein